MYILVQKGPKRFIICPRAKMDKNGRGLRGNISPLTGLLKLKFEWQMRKAVIYRPVKGLWEIRIFD